MIVCPAVCWIWERQVISGGFGGSCYGLLHEEKRRLNKGFLLNHTSEGVYVREKMREGHCQPPSYRIRWDGLILFSQAADLHLSSHSLLVHVLSHCLLSSNAILIHRQTNPLKASLSQRNGIPPCPPLPANPSCLLDLHINPHLQNKQLYTLGLLTCDRSTSLCHSLKSVLANSPALICNGFT